MDFAKAKFSLPSLCFTLVEGITPERQEVIARQITALDSNQAIDPASKATILGVFLIREVGADALEQAVRMLAEKIRSDHSAG